ncbi:MAG: FtsX-like permease family protein [Lachnospiraceae bacterium]|nr:FtsX-like permease family protein [Lachnospiraceae bacterium]
MYPLFFIAKKNLKKKKGDVAVLFILIMLATLLLYVSISGLTGTNRVLDTAYENAHTADYLFITNSERESEIENVLLAQKEVEEYEKTECIFFSDGKYRKDKNVSESPLCIGAADDKRLISKLAGVSVNNIRYSDIYLPFYLKAAQNYKEGDDIFLTFDGKEYKFNVAGFVEDPIFATPLNISIYYMYISRAYMEDIMNENTSFKNSRCMQYKVRLKHGESSNDFDDKIMSVFTEEVQGINDVYNIGLNGELMKGGDALMSNISMGIILIFSALLILVALIIIRFSIHNFMELNLKNMGILQASGYTIRQLRTISVLEMGIIAFFGILAGNMLGILLSDVIGNFQGIMIGISWNQGFNLKISAFTAIITFIIITGVCGISSAVYGKVTVLDALRGGIHTHNFKKNYFPFEKSHLPYSIIMAGKNIMGEKLKNLSILCIMILLSFASCVGLNLYQNFVLATTDNLAKIVGAETGDVMLEGDDLERLGVEIENWDEIDNILYSNSINVKLINGKNHQTVLCDVWNEPAGLKNETIIRGRVPEFDNEIVLTTALADALNVDMGDVVYVESSGKKLDYVISGIDQKTGNMGLKSLMTMEGAKRLNGNISVSTLYLYTHNGVTYEEIQSKISNKFPEIRIINSEKLVAESAAGVKLGMAAICVIFVIITSFAVVMVEVLLVSSKIVKERKNYGINKALGYTTGRLICQTVINNMPIIVTGATLGAIISSFLMNPMMVLAFSFCKMEKISLDINPVWMIVAVIGIAVLAAAISFLSSLKISRIEPVKMLSEE